MKRSNRVSNEGINNSTSSRRLVEQVISRSKKQKILWQEVNQKDERAPAPKKRGPYKN